MQLFQQAAAFSKRVSELEAAQERAAKDQKNSSVKLKQEAEKLSARLGDTDIQLAQLRADYASEQATHASVKKDLEACPSSPSTSCLLLNIPCLSLFNNCKTWYGNAGEIMSAG